jgi:cysteine-rich repeat protein
MQCAVGFVYNPQSELCEEICGDGLRFNLKCDDGNNVNGDGCAMDCRVEEGWTCEGGSPDRKDTCTIFKPT